MGSDHPGRVRSWTYQRPSKAWAPAIALALFFVLPILWPLTGLPAWLGSAVTLTAMVAFIAFVWQNQVMVGVTVADDGLRITSPANRTRFFGWSDLGRVEPLPPSRHGRGLVGFASAVFSAGADIGGPRIGVSTADGHVTASCSDPEAVAQAVEARRPHDDNSSTRSSDTP